jgi:hypothetical protein
LQIHDRSHCICTALGDGDWTGRGEELAKDDRPRRTYARGRSGQAGREQAMETVCGGWAVVARRRARRPAEPGPRAGLAAGGLLRRTEARILQGRGAVPSASRQSGTRHMQDRARRGRTPLPRRARRARRPAGNSSQQAAGTAVAATTAAWLQHRHRRRPAASIIQRGAGASSSSRPDRLRSRSRPGSPAATEAGPVRVAVRLYVLYVREQRVDRPGRGG